MKYLKYLREKAGMTQIELADKLGVDRSSVAKWECGDANPRSTMLPKLAQILNCSIDDFFAPNSEVS